MKRAILILLASASMAIGAHMDFLTIGPNNQLQPAGVAATFDGIAQAAAEAEANRLTADLLTAALSNANARADALETIINQQNGIGYIQGYFISFSAGVQANTNIAASIILLEQAGATSTTSLWRVYTYFTEDPGNWPVVHWSDSLGRTNLWDTAPQVSVVLTNKVIGDTEYECYASTLAMPLEATSAFFRVYCDVNGIGTNQVYMPLVNGASVNGAPPLNLHLTLGTNIVNIVGGWMAQ